MKYKELFCNYMHYIGITLDPHGVSVCVLKFSKHTWDILSLTRIQQTTPPITSIKGKLSLHLTPATLTLLNQSINPWRSWQNKTSLSIPSFCTFRQSLEKWDQAEYRVDTQSPWPAKQCVIKRMPYHPPMLWAIPKEFIKTLEECFHYRLHLKFQQLDVNSLAWMRSLSLLEKFQLPQTLHAYIRAWPLCWYATALGTAWNAYVSV